jgi:FkbM family methyltransferase
MKPNLLPLLRHQRMQRLWEELHRASIIGMNFWASDVHSTGEIDALRYVAAKLTDTERPIVFDVGANVGEFSQMCLEVFRGRCLIHAFEPATHTADLYKEALRSDAAGVHLHRLALSDKGGHKMLYSSERGSTIASLHELKRPIRPFDPQFSEQVAIDTLDRFCAREHIVSIDLLKLDIEGHELHALAGARQLLDDGRIKFIQFEFGENNISSRSYLADFHDLLGNQYRFFRIVPGGLKEWTYRGGASEIFATMNYLCELRGLPSTGI